MTDKLTKDTDKVLCCIYKQYLEKIKSGLSKDASKEFSTNFYIEDKNLSSWDYADITSSLLELGHIQYIRLTMGGIFYLEKSSIIYMENRFKNGLVELVDFISKFIT